MARWKITTYLDDGCQEHDTEEECNEIPEGWDEDEYGEFDPVWNGSCYHAVPKGEIDTREEAQSWMNCLFVYGDKHQEASFTETTIEAVN